MRDSSRRIARWITATLAVCGTLAVAATAEAAPPEAACLMPALESRAEAQRSFQAGLAALIAAQAPAHADLAQLAKELQIGLIDRRLHRVRFLLDADPDMFQEAADLDGFAWTVEAESQLKARDADYAALTQEIEAMGALNNAHPGWPGLRAAYADEIEPSQAHAALVEELTEALDAARPEIAACFTD